jgi:hypothetical protein
VLACADSPRRGVVQSHFCFVFCRWGRGAPQRRPHSCNDRWLLAAPSQRLTQEGLRETLTNNPLNQYSDSRGLPRLRVCTHMHNTFASRVYSVEGLMPAAPAAAARRHARLAREPVGFLFREHVHVQLCPSSLLPPAHSPHRRRAACRTPPCLCVSWPACALLCSQEALSKFMNEKYAFSMHPEDVCVLPSATAALFAAVQAVVDPGDEVRRNA